MKAVVVLLALFAAVFAIDAIGEGLSGSPDQVINPVNWAGTWTAYNRYGGVAYFCPVGNRVYGVYSNAGFFIGEPVGTRSLQGTWYEGGRGDRNNFQGSFEITISADNQEFDGIFNRVSHNGTDIRWHEHRLGAPYPSNPTATQCLTPGRPREYLTGAFFRRPDSLSTAAPFYICRDEYDQIYGSFQGPNGYLEGWSVDDATGFHGWRYDSNGQSGAYILRSLSTNEVRGFYWRGKLASQNIETSTQEILDRAAYTVSLSDCESVGPGFLERLRGPDYKNSATYATVSFFVIAAALLIALF